MIRALDICAGAGGWACAARGLPIQIAVAVDTWDRALKTYEINHPGTRTILGDVRDESTQREILAAGPFDLVLGGIPCEEISVYRNVGQAVTLTAIEAWRATLDTCLDLVKRLAPRWWCLEDVPGVVKHLPPLTPYVIIDAQNYSAQRRRRAYVGRFPITKLGDCEDRTSIHLRPGPYRIGSMAWESEVVSQNAFAKNKIKGIYPDRKCPTVLEWRSRRDNEVVVVDERLPGGTRQIEWQESARLQGFPEDYLFYGSPSDIAKYIGQAVQIDTARAILEAIARAPERNGT